LAIFNAPFQPEVSHPKTFSVILETLTLTQDPVRYFSLFSFKFSSYPLIQQQRKYTLSVRHRIDKFQKSAELTDKTPVKFVYEHGHLLRVL
jgi:hypothetical protein